MSHYEYSQINGMYTQVSRKIGKTDSGLAIMNPSAQRQITQYASSVTDLFKLMTEGKEKEFSDRVHTAGRFVFGEKKNDVPRLLRDDLLDQFSLSGVPKAERVPNNQLALLSMVDCWWKLGLNPYDHMICSTPVCPFLSKVDEGISIMVGNYGIFVPPEWIVG